MSTINDTAILTHWADGANDGLHDFQPGSLTTINLRDTDCAECLTIMIGYHKHCRGCVSVAQMEKNLLASA